MDENIKLNLDDKAFELLQNLEGNTIQDATVLEGLDIVDAYRIIKQLLELSYKYDLRVIKELFKT